MSEVEAGTPVPETDAPVVETEDSTPQATDEQSRAEKRINKITWEKHEAIRQSEAKDARIAELEAQLTQPKPDVKVPVVTDFDNDEEYAQALQDYTVQTAQSVHQQTQAQAEKAAQEAERNNKKQAYQSKVAAYAMEHEGFVEAVTGSNVTISESVEQVLIESDRGPELTHWLAENASEALRINSLPPILAAKELGKIEASLDALKPKKASDAPPPETDISGSDTNPPEGLSDDLDVDTWMERRRAQLRERGKL